MEAAGFRIGEAHRRVAELWKNVEQFDVIRVIGGEMDKCLLTMASSAASMEDRTGQDDVRRGPIQGQFGQRSWAVSVAKAV